jgi:hypothetical protein
MGEAARFMENTWRLGGDTGELKKVDVGRLQSLPRRGESRRFGGHI